MLSLFKAITGGIDWGEMEEALVVMGPQYSLLFVVFFFFSGLGVLNIVTGLFCEGAAANARDEQKKLLEAEAKARRMAQERIRQIFVTVDVDKSGHVDRDEFQMVLSNK